MRRIGRIAMVLAAGVCAYLSLSLVYAIFDGMSHDRGFRSVLSNIFWAFLGTCVAVMLFPWGAFSNARKRSPPP